MKQILAFAAAVTLLTATGAFAQAAMSGPSSSGNMSGNAMMKSGTPASKDLATKDAATKDPATKDKAADIQAGKADADASADASAPKVKSHHRMAKNDAAENASEVEVTRQLNEHQSQMAKGGSTNMQ